MSTIGLDKNDIDTVLFAACRFQDLNHVLGVRLVGFLGDFVDTEIYFRTPQAKPVGVSAEAHSVLGTLELFDRGLEGQMDT